MHPFCRIPHPAQHCTVSGCRCGVAGNHHDSLRLHLHHRPERCLIASLSRRIDDDHIRRSPLFRQLSGNAACIAAEKRRIFHASSRSIFLCILHSLWNNFHANQFRHRICHRQPDRSGAAVQIQQPFFPRQLCKFFCRTIKPLCLYGIHLVKRLRRKINSIAAHGVRNGIFSPQRFRGISQNHIGFLRVAVHADTLDLRILLSQNLN